MNSDKEIMIKLEKAMPCLLNSKHKQTVTKYNKGNFTIRCFDCYKDNGLVNESKGKIEK